MPEKEHRRPNVVVFFTDQQRWDTAGVYGNPMGLTPNLDDMAGRGTLFRRAFTCQPVCGPARGCLQTGLWATQHGVFRNHIPLGTGHRRLGEYFQDAGYRTGYIGKWHLSSVRDTPVPPEERRGYDHWLAADTLEYTSKPYRCDLFDGDGNRVRLPGYRTEALAGAAVDFIQQAGDEPFFLFLSFIEPHQQNNLDRLVAPVGYADRYRSPRYVPWDLVGAGGDWRKELPDYYGMVASLDEALGMVLGALERLGIDDDTSVLFTSDHGCHFRTRNREYKRSPHEASIRIPFVGQGPGFDGGGERTELVSLIDLPPTVLSLAGIEPPEHMAGLNAVELAA